MRVLGISFMVQSTIVHTDLLNKASHLTALCAWDSNPHLPVTPAEAWYWLKMTVVTLHSIYAYFKGDMVCWLFMQDTNEIQTYLASPKKQGAEGETGVNRKCNYKIQQVAGFIWARGSSAHLVHVVLHFNLRPWNHGCIRASSQAEGDFLWKVSLPRLHDQVC